MMKGFIGLDLETSGSDHDESAPIQLGLAWLDKRGDAHYFRSYVGGYNWLSKNQLYTGHRSFNDYVWNSDSAQIHRIPKTTLVKAPRRLQVDQDAQEWLDELGIGDFKYIPVGWNVASFDMPFVKQHFPHLSKRFQYRAVDLNSIVFTIDQMNLYKPQGGRWKFSTIKRVVKERAAARTELEITDTIGWHDAGFDALAGLYAWHEAQKIITEAAISE